MTIKGGRPNKAEALRRTNGEIYYRARVTLADGRRVRVDVPYPASESQASADFFARELQQRENETGELYRAKVSPRVRVGDKYGVLIVLRKSPAAHDPGWICKCLGCASNNVHATTEALLSGDKISCERCSKHQSFNNRPMRDRVGETYGYLTVVKPIPRYGRDEAEWLCDCSACGGQHNRTVRQLNVARRGVNKMCEAASAGYRSTLFAKYPPSPIGLSNAQVRERVRRGWDLERALNTPMDLKYDIYRDKSGDDDATTLKSSKVH